MEKETFLTFDAEAESELMDFLHQHYGLEVFTPGLERTRPLYAESIKRLKQSTKVIIIAGTNGKGQTAHTLAHFLSNASKSWALWTSPHILSVTERFCFREKSGAPRTPETKELFQLIKTSHQSLKEEFSDLKISFYEFLFYVFLKMAEANPPEYLILEVGLGGRLDAVNHFDADCSCITSISRDHQAILGNSYRSILLEKIAVSRPGHPLFTQFHLNFLNELTENYCRSHRVLWHPLTLLDQRNYFAENQNLAWRVFTNFHPELSDKKDDFFSSIPSFKGRREIMTFGKKSLIFIGAHNIDGVRRMLEAEKENPFARIDEVLISFSKRPVDEIEVMLRSMADFCGDTTPLKVTSFIHPKAMSEEEIRATLLKVNKGMLEFVPDWNKHIQKTQACSILVCGSYYFIGEVQRCLLSRTV